MTQNKPDDATPALSPSAAPFDAVAEARRLLRTVRVGSLATLDGAGRPFASLVTVATGPDGSPTLLLSQLTAHTRHLVTDPRCALLLAESGKGDPLAHPRLTVSGTAATDRSPILRERFLRRHPKAALYADFPDFAFWRMDVADAHLNGGFARAGSVAGADLLLPMAGADALVSAEAEAVAHLNSDHAEAIGLYARVLAREGEGSWRATGIDPEGLDLAAGDRTARVLFPVPVMDAGTLRRVLVELAAQARAALNSGSRR